VELCVNRATNKLPKRDSFLFFDDKDINQINFGLILGALAVQNLRANATEQQERVSYGVMNGIVDS
jgi:hypothetical protein